MAYKNALGKALQATTNQAKEAASSVESDLSELMSDPDYLRQSSSLINESLQKGFDVLQLPNGDIVATGTKTIVNTYSWDEKNHKLVKLTASEAKKKSRAKKVDESID